MEDTTPSEDEKTPQYLDCRNATQNKGVKTVRILDKRVRIFESSAYDSVDVLIDVCLGGPVKTYQLVIL